MYMYPLHTGSYTSQQFNEENFDWAHGLATMNLDHEDAPRVSLHLEFHCCRERRRRIEAEDHKTMTAVLGTQTILTWVLF